MALDERTRRLRNEIESNLGPDVMKTFIKDGHIYYALSQAQRDVCMDALCVREQLELELEAGETDYPAAENVHRIEEVVKPAAWSYSIEPKEPENWNVLIEQNLQCRQPLFVTILFGSYVFYPAPQEAQTVKLWLALKPSEDGSDDVDEETEPIVPASFDDALILGATAKLLRKVPSKQLLDPERNEVYYMDLFNAEVEKRGSQTNRVQNRNPRSMREEFRF